MATSNETSNTPTRNSQGAKAPRSSKSSGSNTFDEMRSEDFTTRLSQVRERATQAISDVIPEDMIGQAQDLASGAIRQASTFLRTENGRTAGIVAMVAAAGLVGFLIGRTSSSSLPNSTDI